MSHSFNATDLIEPAQPSRSHSRQKPLNGRVLEPSISSFQKDKALEEVFRKPYRGTASQDAEQTSRDISLNQDKGRGSNAINVTNWMETLLEEGENDDDGMTDNVLPTFNGPKRDSSVSYNRTQSGRGGHSWRAQDLPEVSESSRSPSNQTEPAPSQGSSPVRPMRDDQGRRSFNTSNLPILRTMLSRYTDADGDDEREETNHKRPRQKDNAIGSTNRATTTKTSKTPSSSLMKQRLRKKHPVPSRPKLSRHSTAIQRNTHLNIPKIYPIQHDTSTSATLCQPTNGAGTQIIETSSNGPDESDAASEPSTAAVMHSPPHISGTASPAVANAVRRNRPVSQTPLRHYSYELYPDSSGTRADTRSAVPRLPPGNMATGVQPSDLTHTLDLASDLGDNRAVGNGQPALPSSLGSQMAYAHNFRHHDLYVQRQEQVDDDNSTSSRDVLSRLVLARMKTLEEGFQQVIREVQELRIREAPIARKSRGIGLPRRRFSGPTNVREADKRKPNSRESLLPSRRQGPRPSSRLRPSGLLANHSLVGSCPRTSPLAVSSADRKRQSAASFQEPVSSPTPSASEPPKGSSP